MSVSIERILAVAGRVNLRGGYLQMLELLQGLSARGHEVTLLCARMQSEFFSRGIGFPVHTWAQIAGPWPSLRNEAAIQEFVQRRKAQIIHVHGDRLGSVGRRFLKSAIVPVVFTPHSVLSRLGEIRWIHRRAAKVTALSEHLREGLMNRARVPREKLSVVPPGIESGSADLSRASRPNGARFPRTGGRVPVVGIAAPLEVEREQTDFLEAARMVLDSGLEAEFVVAGDGPNEYALRQQAEDLNLAKHLTFVTQLADYRHVINMLDIFVRPMANGGIGHTVLQAMSMGKPTVVVATANILEIVEDSRTSLVVPKKSAPALAASIGLLLRDPPLARKMGEAARQHVAERFNIDQLVRNTLRVYAEAVA